MGKSIVTMVMEALESDHIRVERGMPGRRMPDIQEAVAAVQLQGMDQEKETVTVLVTVFAPVTAGAQCCETAAVQICDTLQRMDGCCVMKKAEYVKSADLFQLEVSVTFHGAETIGGWVVLPELQIQQQTFVIKLDDTKLSSAVQFSAWQEVDNTYDPDATMEDGWWHFQLEELFQPEVEEEATPESPFTITVIRQGRTEVFSTCTLSSRKRIVTDEGLRQIREGAAQNMTVQ